MSEGQTLWTILWDHAGQDPGPFEVADVAPRVAEAFEITAEQAERKVTAFVRELSRLPDGIQYFTLEGNAVVPLEEFLAAPRDSASTLRAYPFEL